MARVKFTAKQKRMITHIYDGYRKQGVPHERASAIAHATVVKFHGLHGKALVDAYETALRKARSFTKSLEVDMHIQTIDEAHAELHKGGSAGEPLRASESSSVGKARPLGTKNAEKTPLSFHGAGLSITDHPVHEARVSHGTYTLSQIGKEHHLRYQPKRAGKTYRDMGSFRSRGHALSAAQSHHAGMRSKGSGLHPTSGSGLPHFKHKKVTGLTAMRAAGVPKHAMPSARLSNKSLKEDTMSKAYEDLFKSELDPEGMDKVLIACPHCDHPITKAEVIAKAKGGKKASVVGDNKDGGLHRGPASGPNAQTPVRPAGGVPKVTAQPVVGSKGTKKAEDEPEVEKGNDEPPKEPAKKPEAPVAKSVTVRGSEYVQYVNDGSDEALAKAIEEGRIGQGALVNQPIDKNNAPVRNG